MSAGSLLTRIVYGGPAVLEEALKWGITEEDFATPKDKSLWNVILTYYRQAQTKGSVIDTVFLKRQYPDLVLTADRPSLTLEALCRHARDARIEIGVIAALLDCSNQVAKGSASGAGTLEPLQKLRDHLDRALRLGFAAGSTRRDIAEILTTPLPAARWIVEELGLQPGPLVLLAGYGDSAKSMAAQAALLSLASASESPVWGRYVRAKRCRCLHLDYEQGSVESARRYQLLAQGMGLSPAHLHGWLDVDSSPAKLTVKNRAFFEMCARGHDVILLDSFSAATRSAGVDENSTEAAVPLDMLNDIAEQTGCAVWVVHHAGKGSKDDVREVARGSSAIFAAAGGMFAFVRDGEKDEVRVACAKPRNGKRCAPFTLRVEDTPAGGITVLADSAASKAATELAAMAARVVSRLEQEPASSWTGSMKTWKEELGVSNGKHDLLKQALTELQQTGRMTATPVGGSGQKTRYALTAVSAAMPLPGQAQNGVLRPASPLPLDEGR